MFDISIASGGLMKIDYDKLAGQPCKGCGIGDALEILELDGESTFHDGKVYHVDCWTETQFVSEKLENRT